MMAKQPNTLRKTFANWPSLPESRLLPGKVKESRYEPTAGHKR